MIRCNYPTRFVPPAATRAPAAPNPFSMPRVRAGAASPFSKPRHSLATTWRQHILASASSPRAAYTHKTPPRRVCAETPRTPRARRPCALPTPPFTYTPLPTPGRCPWPHGPQGPHAPPRPRRDIQPMPRREVQLQPHTCVRQVLCSKLTVLVLHMHDVAFAARDWAAMHSVEGSSFHAAVMAAVMMAGAGGGAATAARVRGLVRSRCIMRP